ncbi:hypothetical protein WF834_03595, partial [Faecalibacterium sp. HTF-128]
IIESEENIKLAYRTIKRNHGSKTPGVDKKTIRNLAKLSEDEYAVLIQNLSFSDNIISSIWGVMGYTVLLAFTLFKTGSLAKSVFAAH